MMNGTPLVAFNNGGPPETILKGKTDYLVEFCFLNDFGKKVDSIINNKENYIHFSQNCINHVLDKFDFEKNFLDFKNKILDLSI